MASDLAVQSADAGQPSREAVLQALLQEARAEAEAQRRRADAAEIVAAEVLRRHKAKVVPTPADDKLRWLLRLVSAAGGRIEANDSHRGNPLALFYDDEPGTDTFNRAIDLGLVKWSHDSDSDSSTITLSALGEEYLRTATVAEAGAEGWRRMTAAQLRALPSNGTFPALVRLEVGEWAGHIGLPCDPWTWSPEDISEALWLPVDEVVGTIPRDPHGIYIASKAIHGPRWRDLRDHEGMPVIATWIDEAEVGATSDWPDLWSRCIAEAASCSVLIAYREPDEALKGAWVEVGAALAAGRHVIAVGCQEFTVSNHPRVHLVDDLDAALDLAAKISGDAGDQIPAPLVSSDQLRRDLARALVSYGGRLNADLSLGDGPMAWETYLHDADVAIRIVVEACARIARYKAGSSEVAGRLAERMTALIHNELNGSPSEQAA